MSRSPWLCPAANTPLSAPGDSRMLQPEVSNHDISDGVAVSNDAGAALNGIEPDVSGVPEAPSSPSGRDPYRGVVVVLFLAALAGSAGALEAGLQLGNSVLIDTALTLGLAGAILTGVLFAQTARLRPSLPEPETPDAPTSDAPMPDAETSVEVLNGLKDLRARVMSRLRDLPPAMHRWYRRVQRVGFIRVGIAAAGAIGIAIAARLDLYLSNPTPPWAAIVASVCLGGACLAATAAHYLGRVEPGRFPESPALCRGARVVTWLLLMTAAVNDAPALGIPAYFRVWAVSRRRYAFLFVGSFLASATYVAWHDAYLSMKGKAAELQRTESLLSAEKREENACPVSSSEADEKIKRAAILTAHDPALKKNLVELIDDIHKFQIGRIRGTPPLDIKADKDKQPAEWNVEWQTYTGRLAAYNNETEVLYKKQFDLSIVVALKKITESLAIDTGAAQREAKGNYFESERLLYELNRIADKL
jgi:hypothetical protein